MKRQTVLFVLVVFISIIDGFEEEDWDLKCNRCQCQWKSSKRTANCSDTEQTIIPVDLSKVIQSLDLSRNKIPGKPLLRDLFSFHETSLTRPLQQLSKTNCQPTATFTSYSCPTALWLISM